MHLTVPVESAVDRRAFREHVDLVPASHERVRELVRLESDSDLAPARKVVRDHRHAHERSAQMMSAKRRSVRWKTRMPHEIDTSAATASAMTCHASGAA
ncbi:hypothetical protein ACFC1W_04915 [Microbacterium sp. NPDC056003]|uniref:hypothetical protein n=1 Tax=Microbacterium sp. NPDC056003 TaxID=3345676 RepID=UPI0035D9D44A